MKKFKGKIKRALAGFLKEELMEFIGYDHEVRYRSLGDRFQVDVLMIGGKRVLAVVLAVIIHHGIFLMAEDVINAKK